MKTKNIYAALVVLICSVQFSFGQYTMFGKNGTISYDKTMYVKNIVKKQFVEKAADNMKPFFENMVANVPESVVLKKELKFKNNETLFSPAKQELDPKIKGQIMQLALDFDAITLSDLASKDYKRFNDIVGQKLIIQDTVKTIKWTITDEYREIAGYNCRRANGFTPDSTYVIAFYANEIPIDGGPESINGLPGMILGLVVPSQHLSYFATKVEFNDGVVLDKKIFDNAKTQRMSRAEIDKMMTQSMSNFMNKETVKYIMKLALL